MVFNMGHDIHTAIHVATYLGRQELRYNKSMPDRKTDFEKLQEERAAATLLRDEISFIIGFTKASNPEISEGLEKALKMHEEARCQDWL